MLLFLFLNYSILLFNSGHIEHTFNPIAEFIIPLQIPSKEVEAETEI